MKIIANRKIWFTCSGLLFIASVVVLSVWGLRLGVDFTGGSMFEFRVEKEATANDIAAALHTVVNDVQIQQTARGTFLVKMPPVSESDHQAITKSLQSSFGTVVEEQFNSIGPTVGNELKQKTVMAILLVTLMVLVYIAWSFRHVSRPVPSWVYAGIVVFTFIHDVSIPLGIFSALGHFRGLEIGSPFIAAVLTILGYSINDTIVVLDRVRENLRRASGAFEEIVETSVRQTIARSINTSLTTILALAAVFLFGGASIQSFALALIIGIVLGTYSSIFIASPLLVTYYRLKSKK